MERFRNWFLDMLDGEKGVLKQIILSMTILLLTLPILPLIIIQTCIIRRMESAKDSQTAFMMAVEVLGPEICMTKELLRDRKGSKLEISYEPKAGNTLSGYARKPTVVEDILRYFGDTPYRVVIHTTTCNVSLMVNVLAHELTHIRQMAYDKEMYVMLDTGSYMAYRQSPTEKEAFTVGRDTVRAKRKVIRAIVKRGLDCGDC